MKNLLGIERSQLEEFISSMGERRFRAQQVYRWIHQAGISEIAEMTDVAKQFRSKLAEVATIQGPALIGERPSSDGCRKFLFDVGSGNAVESVFIPEENRGTLCISSQAGCALECAFCATGHQGFGRNLDPHEIIGQIWTVKKLLGDFEDGERRISNVVFMGMGEPLTNLENTVRALHVMLDDNAYGLSRRRITVSTAGVVPGMLRLSKECPVALAVSLHAPSDALRDELVPINRKYPLETLMEACHAYLEYAPRDYVTFEYVMLDGVNDTSAHASQLVERVKSVKCKINLIPFNRFGGSRFRPSPRQTVDAFAERLRADGLVVTVRKTRGDDIDAACGQLAGQVINRRGRARMQTSVLSVPLQIHSEGMG